MEGIPTLESFLEGLKLFSLAEMFFAKNITTVDKLISFDDDALKDIGVEKPGHRKRMINELKSLRKRLAFSEKVNISPTIKNQEQLNFADEQGFGSVDNFPTTEIPAPLSEEEVEVDRQKAVDIEPADEEIPPVPPKKSSKGLPPVPLPRTCPLEPSYAAGEAPLPPAAHQTNSQPSLSPEAASTPEELPTQLPPAAFPITSQTDFTYPAHVATEEPQSDFPPPPVLPRATEALSSPINATHAKDFSTPIIIEDSTLEATPSSVEAPDDRESVTRKKAPVPGKAPAIPPRIDLEEKSPGSNSTFVSKDDLSRSRSMPMKKLAPKPPEKARSFKDNIHRPAVSPTKDKCGIPNGTNDSLLKEEHNAEPDLDKIADNMRPTSLSMVKNLEFLGRINSMIQSPKRPAPAPPKELPAQTSIGNEKTDNGSTEGDGELPASKIEPQKQPVVILHGNGQPIRGGSVGPDNRGSKMDVDTKSGFLEKRGGQNNTKAFQKRWVVFDGKDLRYYRPNDKDARSDCLHIVPLHRMLNVKIDESGKRHQFSLETPNRTFIFALDDHNEIGLWANILMKAICLKDKNPAQPSISTVGGDMADPDKEGWLRKQGHNIQKDWNSRYIVVKDGKLAYYRSYEDYAQDVPLNCLNMALSKVMPEANRFRITIKTAQQRDFLFEASDEASFQSWITAFETSIQFALGDTEVLKAIQENPANKYCADCGKRNPVWASVNLLVIVCDNCIGCHRKLGAQISKARSILMDVKVWTPSLKQMMQTVGNEKANSFWEYKLPEDDKINPDSSSNERYDFIVTKYKEKKYINFSQFYGQAANLGNALRSIVLTDDVLTTLQLIICGASVYYTNPGSEDQRTPYELATDANQKLQRELLQQFNGHYTAEERRKEEEEEMERLRKANEEPQEKALERQQTAWEKQGVLAKRGPRNNEPWRKRVFYLQKRSLYYQTDKERELIDLKEVTDIQLGVNDNDPSTINIVLPTRTFYLKGESVREAESWYWAIKNKQVFGVEIKNQDLNSKCVPLLVAKCIDYVEYYALQEEGIYRRSGSLSTIKGLRLAFDQDAPGIRLTTDNYPNVHDICGIFKLYLREGLPEPLTTSKLYRSFIANAAQTDHNLRLTTLYELIRSLPEVNLSTLKRIVLHLNKVIRKSDENKMSQENVNRIFAPIVLNQGNSTSEQMLNKEYTVFDDILTYDTYFFDIDPNEEAKKDQEIETALKTINDAMNQQNRISEGCKINEIQIPVSIENTQRSCMVKVNSKTTASEVCWYIIKLMSLSFDANWSLFEKIAAAGLERPLHTKDLVFPIVMESSKWEGGNWMLTLKNNYVAEMTAPYQDNRLTITGKLYWKKNDSNWKENHFKIRTGDLVVSVKDHGSENEKLPLHQWILYIGTDDRAKKKSPKKYGFTLIKGNEKRYVCTDDEKYMFRWVSAILQIKHPSGIWTNLRDLRDAERRMTEGAADLVPLAERKSVYLGRQSTYRRHEGSSSHIQKELQVKRRSLKKVR